MPRPYRGARSLLVIATILVVCGLTSPTSPAMAAQEADPEVESSGLLQPDEGAGEYWTPTRRAAAVPVDMTVPGAPNETPAEPEDRGPQVTVEPAMPDEPIVARDDFSAQPGASPARARRVPRPYTNAPDRLNGKVFFTDSGRDFVCSGTALRSQNRSVVWTAGHCVHGGRGRGFVEHWQFVPAYSSASQHDAPYGTWQAQELLASRQWVTSRNFRFDLGAAVVERIDGRTLVGMIGGQGITFNRSRTQRWSAFGYPAEGRFDGDDQYRCNSKTTGSDSPGGPGPSTIRIRCDMTGGSSGGGWLIDLGSRGGGLGYLNGVNSYGYEDDPNQEYGPYFGKGARRLYNRAERVRT